MFSSCSHNLIAHQRKLRIQKWTFIPGKLKTKHKTLMIVKGVEKCLVEMQVHQETNCQDWEPPPYAVKVLPHMGSAWLQHLVSWWSTHASTILKNNIRVSPLEQTPTCKYENPLQFFLLAISLFCSHALQDSSASTALNTHVRRLRVQNYCNSNSNSCF
jgi:hypothetical protein